MTRFAQNLNIIRVMSMLRIFRPSQNVMALKVFCRPTFFASANLFNFVLNNLSNFMRSFRHASFPSGMIFSAWHLSPRYTAFGRTEFFSTVISQTTFKRLPAVFAGILNHSFGFLRSQLNRAFTRACMRLGADMSVWAYKFSSACFANKGRVTAFFYVTGLNHGHA